MADAEEKLVFTNSHGQKLAAVLADPAPDKHMPIAILCHGFTTQKNNDTNLALTQSLNQNGIATFRYDFFGHGESEGDFADITLTEGTDDVLSAIKFVKDRGNTKIAIVGSSYGGIAVLLAAAKSSDLSAVAGKSPVSDYPEVEMLRRTEDDIAKWQKDGFTIHRNSKGTEFKLNYSFWQDMQSQFVYDIADRIKVPTLIIHGTADESVPIEQSRKTAQLIPNCQLIEIEDADHRYSKKEHFDQMIASISDFLVKTLSKE